MASIFGGVRLLILLFRAVTTAALRMLTEDPHCYASGLLLFAAMWVIVANRAVSVHCIKESEFRPRPNSRHLADLHGI